MNLRLSLLLFSLLGISAGFMPWLYFPKTDMYFYGYRADGAVTGILFFFVLMLSVYFLKKKQFRVSGLIFSGLIGLLMAYLAYHKWDAIEHEKLNFSHENPMLNVALAGTTQGMGIYFTGIAGLGILITSIGAFFVKNKTDESNSTDKNSWISNPKYLFPILLIPVSIYIGYQVKDNITPAPDVNALRPSIDSGITAMGQALADGDYLTFIGYNHLIMVQSMGGKEKMLDLIKSTMEGLKEKGTQIDRITLSDIYDVSKQGKEIQAIVTQKVIYVTDGNEVEDLQKLIAVSDDNGASWHYINITGKTKAEMIKFFPSLHPDLEF